MKIDHRIEMNVFHYFSIQNGYYCSCGDSYGQYGKSSGCNVNCVGNAQQKCGGPWANSLYQIIPRIILSFILRNSLSTIITSSNLDFTDQIAT